MTKLVLLDARLFVGGVDLSGMGNKIELGEEWDAKQTTNWRSGGAVEVIAGIGKVDASAEGQWEAGDATKVDDAMWANRRVIEPWSASASGESDLAAGNLMYLTQMLRTKATIWGDVGEVAGWKADAKGSWPLVRGQSAHPSGVPRTATGNGTAVQLGAVTAGHYLYANQHILSATGTATPTITISVQSDDNSGFTTPTTRGSFAAKTAANVAASLGGEAIRIAGPITDDWWRVIWTISGTNPSFLFLSSFGIE
jgi:hypothetical protein